MRIAVLGAGGVGGYFGGRLAAAGEDVAFLARGAHLRALRERGLRIASARGDLDLRPVVATDDPAEIGPVDLVLFAVKLWDTETAAAAARPLLGPGTAVVTVQNGVESVETLGRALGPERVLGGTTYISVVIESPGVIRHTGSLARLIFGAPDGRPSPPAEALLAACRRAGIDAELSPRIVEAIWEKFIFLAAFSGITALTRRPIGEIRERPELRGLMVEAIGETAAVARAAGIAVPRDIVQRHTARFESMPPETKSSMLQDLERGGRLELPWLSGAVIRLGERYGVATPVHRLVAEALRLHVGGVTG